MGEVKASRLKTARRQHIHVTVAADIKKTVKDIQKRTGRTESEIVEQGLRDGFASWDRSGEQRAMLDDDLATMQSKLDRLGQHVLLLLAKQNLDGALAYPAGAPMKSKVPETWDEWQNMLLRIRTQLDNNPARKSV